MANKDLLNPNYNKKTITVFYACDDNFVKFCIVSIKSLLKNANKDYYYVIHVLNSGLSKEMENELKKLNEENVKINLVCVADKISSFGENLPIRDYYSKTTYFRMLIANLFPEYDKALYIDSDTVVLGDVSVLFGVELGDNLVGACNEQAMVQTDVYGDYVEKVMGIDRNKYFNAGVLLINCKLFREENVLEQFIKLLDVYTFVVTQDEDYLNVICQNRVLWLEQAWNVEVYGDLPVKECEIKIIHYIMVSKPWRYEDCRLKEYFWKYAKQTDVYDSILSDFKEYSDENRQQDLASLERLAQTASEEAKREDTYIKLVSEGKSADRLKVIEKIRRYEIEKKFDVDVENDPETIPLKPDMVDYLSEKPLSKLKTKFANYVAQSFYERRIKKSQLIIKDVIGIENFKAVKGGAFLTCNHFNANDNYAIWRAIRNEFPKGKRLYKIIREGNYTNFKGLYGFFFRNCNTLPLSSNMETMKNFLTSISVLLKRGEKILIYPEQAMWWNYKKPRPMKNGAFKMAVKNKVPVIPCFITMEDTSRIDQDGFNIQAYTVWILPAIYPKDNLTEKENADYLREENYRLWKELYEKVYGEKLKYGD